MNQIFKGLKGQGRDNDPFKHTHSQLKGSNIEDLQTILLTHTQYMDFGQCPIDELGIVEKDRGDLLELKYILGDILEYPSTQIAQLHKECFRLGNQDLKDGLGQLQSQDLQELDKQIQFCPCCGFVKQQSEIKLCTKISGIRNFGISTYLYFQTLWDIAIMLIVLFIIYGIFALVTNIIAAINYEPDQNFGQNLKTNIGLLALALGSKQVNSAAQQNQDFYYAQCWIGLLIVFIWGFGLYFFKHRQKKVSDQIQYNSKSAADYSIMINNISTAITQEQLQKQFDDFYFEHSYQGYDENLNSLTIAKLNLAKPFYLDESRFKNQKLEQLNEQYQSKIEQFKKWVIMRIDGEDFPFTKQQRDHQYQEFNKIKNQREQILQKIVHQIKEEIFEKNNQQTATTTAFVTFQNKKAKQFILSAQLSGIGEKIGYYLTCCWGKTRFHLTDEEGRQTKAYIQQAPEPEDVIWINLGLKRSQMIKRKFITFLVTIILLGISFAIVYGLSQAQVQNSNNLYISFLISLVIAGFNVIITQILKFLTSLERNYTDTNRQASLAVKAVIALMINSIFIPIMVNYYLKQQNLYGLNGLAYDVFFLALTNSFVGPLVRIFNVHYFLTRLYARWKKKPKNKLGLNQIQLNRINEKIQFEVGFQYVYVINLFIFTAYFTSLHPITPVFAVLGITLMHWVQKFNIFYRCRRPVPGGNLVNQAMFQFISFGPLVFSLGNLTWSNFFPDGEPKYALVPNLIACGFALILFLLPHQKIVQRFYPHRASDKRQLFSENRIFLPSQYDRLNPSTSSKSVEQYLEYVKIFREELKKRPENQIRQIQKLFINQVGRRARQQNLQILPNAMLPLYMTGINQNANFVNGLFGQQQNTMNPLLVLDAVIPEKKTHRKKPLTMVVQNWKTATQRKIFHKKANKPIPLLTDDQEVQEKFQEGLHNLFNPKGKMVNPYPSSTYKLTKSFYSSQNPNAMKKTFNPFSPNSMSATNPYINILLKNVESDNIKYYEQNPGSASNLRDFTIQ